MSQTLTGARAIFRISGTKVAFASNVSYTINHDHQPIEVLDRLEPVEQAEVGYSVSFSCNVFRVANQSIIGLGFMPILEEILVQPELIVEIQDKITSKTLLRITGVKCTSRSGGFDARGVSTESWNFVGIRASDEAKD